MTPRYLALSVAVALAWACPLLLADEEPAVDEDRIAELINQLDADAYAEREAAALGVAMQLHLKRASVAAAERILADRRREQDGAQPELNSTFLAIHALMLWGRENRHVKLVEPYLSDNRQRRLGGYKGKPPRKSIFMREWAMTALLRMTGRNAEALGKPTSLTTYCAATRWVNIQIYTPEAWGDAPETWRTWSQKNLGQAVEQSGPLNEAEEPEPMR